MDGSLIILRKAGVEESGTIVCSSPTCTLLTKRSGLVSAQRKESLSFLMTFTMELDFPWQISQTIGRADFFGQQKLLSLSQGL